MRTLKLLLAVAALTFATPALAQKRGGRIGAGKNLGLGVAVGSPSFLTAKYFLDSQLALDVGVDFVRWGYGFGIHGDVLYHIGPLLSDANLAIPIYLGGGAALTTWDRWGWYDRWGRRHRGGVNVALRGVVGAAVWLKKVPLEFFVEVGPEFWIVYGPDIDPFGSIGVRYYF